jgi:hypothetical protein
MLRHALMFFCAAVVAGCAITQTGPRLSHAAVIRIADAEARRQGYDLRAFERPKARYNLAEREDTWWVFYEGKAVDGMTTTGNHFSLMIDDKSGRSQLMPGR